MCVRIIIENKSVRSEQEVRERKKLETKTRSALMCIMIYFIIISFFDFSQLEQMSHQESNVKPSQDGILEGVQHILIYC